MIVIYTAAIFSLLLMTLLMDKYDYELFQNVTAYKDITPEELEEIRENLLEVRLSLQKGDLIEALQHLNNAEEELLLLSSEIMES